jgi:hypothetical protein
MPNITENRVRFISKNKSSLEKVKNSLMTTEIHTQDDGTKETYLQVFDFDKIVPMPKHIFRGNLGDKERKKYGKNNWYDWSYLHWGTKWNAMYAKITEDNENALSYYFESAWDCPRGIAYAIEDFLPKDVKVDYWDCKFEQVDQETGEWEKEIIFPLEKGVDRKLREEDRIKFMSEAMQEIDRMSNNGTLENTTPIEIVEKVSSANNT